MQSFRIDFTMNQGHEMTLDREGGIYRSELEEIELLMLQNERIPYLLPVDWFELDGKLTFRYKLSGMKMLLHRLNQQKLTMEQFYSLILGVTDALFECRHYMLRPEGCLLHEQFIFIGENLHDIRLAYVPMKGDAAEQFAGAGSLQSLIVRFTSYIDQIDGEGLKLVLHHLTGTRWPISELRATLLHLIGEAPSKQQIGAVQSKQQQMQQSQQSQQAKTHSWTSSDQRAETHSRPSRERQAVPSLRTNLEQQAEAYKRQSREQHAEPPGFQAMQQPQQQTYSPPSNDYSFNIDSDDEKEDEIERSASDTKKKWLLSAGVFVAIACVWRFVYFAAADKQRLLISLGISLLLLAVMLLVWRRRDSQHADSEDAEFDIGLYEPDSRMFPELMNMYDEHDRNGEASKPSPDDLYEANRYQSAASFIAVAANPLSSVVEPTVLLGNDQQKETTSEHAAAWLLRSFEGEETKLELIERSFKIGRMGEQVSYAEHAGGVSRLHLEIENFAGDYKAKDLGSRNGSLLNGQTMIPYKSYKLSSGDIIQLAGASGPSYAFKS